MAKKLGASHSKNTADNAGRRRGFKVFPGQYVKAGGIILRQQGTKFFAGLNTILGRDFSINSTISGWVNIKTVRRYNGKICKYLNVSSVLT